MTNNLPEHPAAQELFDFVCRHFNAQGGPAKDEAGNCVCRTPDGRSCAFGSVMTDEEAKIADASTYAPYKAMSIEDGLTLFNSRFKAHRELLESLRECHDGARSIERLQNMLQDVANQYDLKLNVIVERWNA